MQSGGDVAEELRREVERLRALTAAAAGLQQQLVPHGPPVQGRASDVQFSDGGKYTVRSVSCW